MIICLEYNKIGPAKKKASKVYIFSKKMRLKYYQSNKTKTSEISVIPDFLDQTNYPVAKLIMKLGYQMCP